mmetsp:Transcript_59099/g.86532  ORF Transcript_59099/g.86532 Transcript_59099/m.86532 type:complete len:87 (+) Transcript_59099:65-325(+)
MDPNRIFMPEQIEVHPDLPGILKDYSKAVIRAAPKDIYAFSVDYFREKAGLGRSQIPTKEDMLGDQSSVDFSMNSMSIDDEESATN